jgi:uncharacterized membrane protein YsdA (DUF1294 family)
MNWFYALPLLTQLLLFYFTAINLIAFVIYGIDKAKSRNNSRRYSEKTLWLLAFVGGSLGSLLAMKIFRHKTKKISFQALLAVILAMQLVVMVTILSL